MRRPSPARNKRPRFSAQGREEREREERERENNRITVAELLSLLLIMYHKTSVLASEGHPGDHCHKRQAVERIEAQPDTHLGGKPEVDAWLTS